MNRLKPALLLSFRPTSHSQYKSYIFSKAIALRTSTNMSAGAPKAAETDVQAEATANATGVTSESLQSTLKEKVAAQYVEIEDMSGRVC